MKITVGKYEIFNTGNLIVKADDPVLFELVEDKFYFEVFFRETSDSEKFSAKAVLSEDKKKITVEFFNANSTTGIINTTPGRIGTFKGRELYFTYVIFSFSNEEMKFKSFHYALMLGDNVGK